jgi:HNH endonuclease
MKPIWCEAHHVKEYDRDNGPTDIDNMALLCSRHHTRVHSVGWSAKMEPGQYLAIATPDGRVLRGPPRTLV